MKYSMAIALLFMSLTGLSAVEIIAHRGENSVAPENSVESAKAAWALGAKALECDIHAIDSGEFVCIHCEEVLEKMSGVKKPIKSLTSGDLAKIDLSNNSKWRGKFKDVRLPTYEDIVATVSKDGVLVVEIKEYSPEFVSKTDSLVKKYGLNKSQIIFISFDHDCLKDVKNRSKDYAVLLLSSLKSKGGKTLPTAESMIEKCREIGAEGVNLGSNTKLLDAEYVSKIHDAGLKFYVWTVNDLNEAQRLKSIGVDGITTDAAFAFKSIKEME